MPGTRLHQAEAGLSAISSSVSSDALQVRCGLVLVKHARASLHVCGDSIGDECWYLILCVSLENGL